MMISRFFYTSGHPNRDSVHSRIYDIETNTDVINDLAHVMRLIEDGKTPDEIWAQQKRRLFRPDGSLISAPYQPLESIENACWILNAERKNDLKPPIMDKFKRCAEGKLTDDAVFADLPCERRIMIADILTRPARLDKNGRRVLDFEQMALAAHLTKIHASIRATQEIFSEPRPSPATIASLRRVVQWTQGSFPDNGWNWQP